MPSPQTPMNGENYPDAFVDFHIEKKTIGDVYIRPKTNFIIPRFQRQYTWEEKNVEEFWTTIQSRTPEFLGTIIFKNPRKKNDNVLEIIDGQQRYLTIQILGAVIRDLSNELAALYDDKSFGEIAKGTMTNIIGKADEYDSKKFEYYLKPGDSIRDFFLDHIQTFEPKKKLDDNVKVKKKSEPERIRNTYIKFKELVSNELESKSSPEDKKNYLKELVTVSLSKHFFARIEISNPDLAYEIFETVNAKGVDLSAADLIKNQIFRHVLGESETFHDSAKERWAEMSNHLSAAELSVMEFLSYYWTSKYGYVANGHLYRVIRETFGSEPTKWDTFLDDLNQNARYIALIFAGNLDDFIAHFGNEKEALRAYESLRILRNMKAKTWIVLYLNLFRNLDGSSGNKPKLNFELNKRWEIIQEFTFLYFEILGLPGNWYFRVIWNFCKELETVLPQQPSPKQSSELFRNKLLSEFLTQIPTDPSSFYIGFSEIRYGDDKRSRTIIRYVLSKIDNRNDESGEGFDEAKVSIEHILPQDPKLWGLLKKDIKEHVNKIGNLLLIGKRINGNVGNDRLEDKLPEYSKSNRRLVIDFCEKAETKVWDFEAIEQKDFSSIETRQKSLGEEAFDIWAKSLRSKMGY